jgi:hypothetical protein
MSNKNKRAYRQGVVNTIENPPLQKSQIVDIIFEGHDFYIVQSYTTATQEKIEKKFIDLT